MHDASVRLPVAAGDQRGALGQLVFADLAVEDELIQGGLHHRHRRRQLFEVDEPAAAKGMGNVMVAVIDVLIEKGVFSIEEIRDMLDRLEVTVRRAEGEIEGDLPQEAEVAATMAIVDHLRDILISKGRPG